MKNQITLLLKWQLVILLGISCYLTSSRAQTFHQQTVFLQHLTISDTELPAGVITLTETAYGLLITPNLKGLMPGIHGFHIHTHPSCKSGTQNQQSIAALSAGGHFDPDNTEKHLGPYSVGHLGDLPAIYVNQQGIADYPVFAPRIKSLKSIQGRSLIIHAGGDNHSDHPLSLGGGGSRIACGIIRQ